MTSNVLVVPATQEAGQYRVQEEDRQAILSRSDSARRREKIERQRLAFIERFGAQFGTDDTEQS